MTHSIHRSGNPAVNLKLNIITAWLSYKHRQIPLLPKLIALLLVAYACSPIDLIPDFIPVIGYLDELIILPAGIYLLTKLIPASIWIESKQKAQHWIEENKGTPKSYTGAIIIVVGWILIAWVAWWLMASFV